MWPGQRLELWQIDAGSPIHEIFVLEAARLREGRPKLTKKGTVSKSSDGKLDVGITMAAKYGRLVIDERTDEERKALRHGVRPAPTKRVRKKKAKIVVGALCGLEN
jgi:hypothetical protein